MAAPLDGCRAKIERAKEQVRNLNDEITTLINRGSYHVVGENQMDRSRYVFKLIGPPVPMRLAVLTGKIAHHLRSILDHIVWALARKNGVSEDIVINFPVRDTPEKFKKAVKDGIIKGVSRVHHPMIERMQPYHSTDPPNSFLRVLHDLDVTDKHQLLVMTVSAVRMGDEIILKGNVQQDMELIIATAADAFVTRSIFTRTIEDGIETHWIRYRPPDPNVEIENNFTVQVAFAKIGTLEREPIIPILLNLCNAMEGTIQTFDACF